MNEALLAETTLTIKKNHEYYLDADHRFLMHQIDLTPKDLDLLVAEGPGVHWTALRSQPWTLAHTLGVELVRVSRPLVPSARWSRRFGSACHGCPSEHVCRFTKVISWGRTRRAFSIWGSPRVQRWVSRSPLRRKSRPLRSRLPLDCQGYLLWNLARCSEKSDVSVSNKPVSLLIFVPHYLKRVEAEENWLKGHTETTTSCIKRLWWKEQSGKGATKMRLPFSLWWKMSMKRPLEDWSRLKLI